MNNGFGRQALPFFQANLMGGLLGNNPMSNNRGVVQNVAGGRWQAGAGQNKSNFVNQRTNNNNRLYNNQPQRNTNGNKSTNDGNQVNQTNKAATMNPNVQARLGPATTGTKTAEKITAVTKADTLVPPPSRPVLMRPGQEKITAPKQEIKAPTDTDAIAIKAHVPSASSGPKSSVNAKATTQVAKSSTDTSTPPPLMKKQLPSAMPTSQASAPQKNQMVSQDLSTKPPALPTRFAHRLSAPGNRNTEVPAAVTNSAPVTENKQGNQQDQQQSNKTSNEVNATDGQNNQQNKQMNNNRFGANNNRQGPGANKPFNNNQFNNRQQNFQNRPNRSNYNNQQGGYQGSNRQNEKSSGGQQRRSAGGGPNNYGQDKFWDRLHELSGPQYDLEPLDMTEQKFNAQSRLFVGSLSREGTLDELKELFSKHGELGQVYYNKEGGYAFINFDFHNNAEKAARELNNHTLRGRQIKVRFAAITTGVKVRNLPPSVTNELLYKAFGVFGPVEVSRVVVDDRGKPTGDGIVIFTEKKSAVMAFKKCQEHAYFLTNQLRPVIVEPWETRDDEEGYPEASINKNDAYMRDRKIGPRFAAPNSAESDYAKHWKQLFDIYKEKKQALESDLKAEMEALEVKMQLVIHQQETDKLRKELAQREQEARQLEMGLYGEPKLSQMTDEPPPYARGGGAMQVSPGGLSSQVKRSHDFYEAESPRGSTRYDRYGAYEAPGSGYYRGAATYDRTEDSRTTSSYGTTANYGAGYASATAAETTPAAKPLTSQPPPAITPATAAPAAYEERTATAGAYESAEGTYDDSYGQGYESYEGSTKRGRY